MLAGVIAASATILIAIATWFAPDEFELPAWLDPGLVSLCFLIAVQYLIVNELTWRWLVHFLLRVSGPVPDFVKGFILDMPSLTKFLVDTHAAIMRNGMMQEAWRWTMWCGEHLFNLPVTLLMRVLLDPQFVRFLIVALLLPPALAQAAMNFVGASYGSDARRMMGATVLCLVAVIALHFAIPARTITRLIGVPSGMFAVGLMIAIGAAFLLSVFHVDGSIVESAAASAFVAHADAAPSTQESKKPPLDASALFVQYVSMTSLCLAATFVILPHVCHRESARVRLEVGGSAP